MARQRKNLVPQPECSTPLTAMVSLRGRTIRSRSSQGYTPMSRTNENDHPKYVALPLRPLCPDFGMVWYDQKNETTINQNYITLLHSTAPVAVWVWDLLQWISCRQGMVHISYIAYIFENTSVRAGERARKRSEASSTREANFFHQTLGFVGL